MTALHIRHLHLQQLSILLSRPMITLRNILPTHVNSDILPSDSKFFSLSCLEHLETAGSQTPSLSSDLQMLSIYVPGSELLALSWL